ncbi:hypothetical protein PIB30_085223 [Stylosanthes scabra]|uniref:Uncharacterized protein n=1 Tax=Stylosanthes scabra TaxID=79078 RepID=A0ABU6SSZ7_9FABA|nr:hypothetical protein [Stylosanthes scabra]
MNHAQHHTATVEEAATVEHVWNLITVARAPEFYAISRCPRRRWIERPEVVMRQLGIADRYPTRLVMVPEEDWSGVAFWKSRQATLRQLCDSLQIPPPGYVQDTRQAPGVGTVHRFIVACAPSPDLHVVSGAGRFSTDIHIAREDGGAALTTTLLGATQMNLSDYRTDLLRAANAEIADLRHQLDEVKVKHATLKVKYMDLRGDFAPGAAPHSSNSDDN